MPNLNVVRQFDWMKNNPLWKTDYATVLSMADSLEAKDAMIISLRAELAARTHATELDANTAPEMSDVALALRDKEFEIGQLRGDCQAFKEETEIANFCTDSRDAEIEQLRSQLAATERGYKSLRDTAETEYARLRALLLDNESELERFRRAWDNVAPEMAEFNEKIGKYQEALEGARQDEKIWRVRFDELMSTFNSLKQSENTLATQLAQLRYQHGALKATIRAAVEEDELCDVDEDDSLDRAKVQVEQLAESISKMEKARQTLIWRIKNDYLHQRGLRAKEVQGEDHEHCS